MSDDFDAERAARMYPSTPPDTSEPAAAVPVDETRQAPPAPRTDVPPHIAGLRSADLERRLYGAQSTFQHTLPDGALGPDIDHAEAREVAMDLGAEDADLQTLASLAREAPTDEQVDAWRAETQQYLQRMHVSAGDLDLARALVARDPRLAAYLDSTGLGNHPKVVERMISLAKTQAALGRLGAPR